MAGKGQTEIALALLSAADRKYMEDIVAVGAFPYQSEFTEKLKAEGEAIGRSGDIVIILEARGLPVSDEARERITHCTDLDTLDRWIRRAVTATSAEELFD